MPEIPCAVEVRQPILAGLLGEGIQSQMSYSLNFLERGYIGILKGSIVGVIKGGILGV